MSKRTFFVLFTVMLTVLVAGRVRTLPHAPPLPEALEQAENGWYWGESVDALAAAVPSEKGLTVYWVDKAQPLRLFFRECKTSDPAEALKLAAKRPQYGPNLQFDMDKYNAGEQMMINAGMAALREAGTQGNGGRLVEMLTLPRGTHKAGASLVLAAVFEVAPQRVLTVWRKTSIPQCGMEMCWREMRISGCLPVWWTCSGTICGAVWPTLTRVSRVPMPGTISMYWNKLA